MRVFQIILVGELLTKFNDFQFAEFTLVRFLYFSNVGFTNSFVIFSIFTRASPFSLSHKFYETNSKKMLLLRNLKTLNTINIYLLREPFKLVFSSTFFLEI